jgi:transposase
MGDRKQSSLREHHCLNRHPEKVKDLAFTSGNAFFDPRDLVQVKYEMLRRVRKEGQPVTEAAKGFGLSRPSFYEAQAAFKASGLIGLLPRRPGPRRAHKLTDAVLDFAEEVWVEDPSLAAASVAKTIRERFGCEVHPGSISRALRRRQKKRNVGENAGEPPSCD